MRQQLALVLLALASQCQAQAVDYDSSNPNQDILGCDALTCAQDNENAICSFGPSGIGVGFVPRTVNLSDSTSLSLTLVDGYPLGNYGQSQETYDFSTRTLYIHRTVRNTTTCPDDFLFGNTRLGVTTYVRDFEYSNSSNLGRCESLALYVEQQIRYQLAFGVYYGALVSVAGGAISGPALDTSTPAQIVSDVKGDTNLQSCQPVLPQNYQLYEVANMTEILRGDSLDPDTPYGPNTASGGRTGYTPIVSVLYDDDNDYSDPEVAFNCMHIRQTDGAELPFAEVDEENSSTKTIGKDLFLGLLVLAVTMRLAW